MAHRLEEDQPSNSSQELWDLLASGEMRDCRLAPSGSNYTFYAALINTTQQQCRVVYKPRSGEAPLWDFPDGTLYLREYAAYVVSEALGWGFVPPTVIRQGIHGIGSVQLYVESEQMDNYFTLRDAYKEELLRICAFDVIANNADRKASHCLLSNDGCIWAIDHGLLFHSQPKLRTVIWDYAGDPIPQGILDDLDNLLKTFDEPEGLCEILTSLLSRVEVEAFLQRVEVLLDRRDFPLPGPQRSIPWPWI